MIEKILPYKKPLPSQERLHELFLYNQETGVLSWAVRRGNQAAGNPAGRVLHNRLQVRVDGIEYMLHRVVWVYFYGSEPRDQIDHINGNALDNRISNLRDVSNATNAQNQRGKRKDNSTGYMGVYKCRDKFVAQITVDCKVRRIGGFNDPETAHAAYLSAKRRLHQGCTI